MRFGVRLGPFYAGTSTRRSNGGCLGMIGLIIALCWPLALPGAAKLVMIPWAALVVAGAIGAARSRRRAAPRGGPGRPVHHAVIRLSDGSERQCHHEHRTEGAARECGARMARQLGQGPA